MEINNVKSVLKTLITMHYDWLISDQCHLNFISISHEWDFFSAKTILFLYVYTITSVVLLLSTSYNHSTITTSFWNDGKASLEFDNCNNEGRVTVLLDGKEIGHSTPNKESTTVAFNVAEGSVLSIKTDSSSIIRLVDMKLECGETMIYQYDI